MQVRSVKYNCLSLPALHPFLVCHVHRLGRLYPEEKQILSISNQSTKQCLSKMHQLRSRYAIQCGIMLSRCSRVAYLIWASYQAIRGH